MINLIIPRDSDFWSLFVISRYFMGITADAFGKCLASRICLIALLEFRLPLQM